MPGVSSSPASSHARVEPGSIDGPPLIDSPASQPIPNFFVVGAGKAGTTSLDHYLRIHPQVYMSPIKEPCFFAADIDARDFAPEYRYEHYHDYKQYLLGDMTESIGIAYVADWNDNLAL